MSEPLIRPRQATNTVLGKTVEWACIALAVLGGILFLVEAVMSVVSVLGRTFFASPIPGDYELVQLMSVMGIAMCLPYCQLRRGHVFVDFFTLWAPSGLKRVLDILVTLVLAAVAFLLAWRCYIGTVETREYLESTMVLGLPIWWGYAPLVPSFFLLGVTSLYTAGQDIFIKDSNDDHDIHHTGEVV